MAIITWSFLLSDMFFLPVPEEYVEILPIYIALLTL
jgi:hypothetical protein